MGRDDLAREPDLRTASGRRAARRRLDAEIAAWTGALEAGEVESRLQAVGVPAHRVAGSPEVVADPQLRHRGHWVEVDHHSGAAYTVDGPSVRLSATPGGPRRAGPGLNEHLVEVLGGLLGYDDDRIAALAADGIFQ